MRSLDPAVADALATDGYVVLEDLLAAAVTAIAARVDDALSADEYRRQGGTLHVADLAGPEIERMRDDLLPAVACMLGEGATFAGAHFRAPLPGHGGQGLHAYFGGPPPADGPAVAVAIVALVDVTADGGATRVVPGTHAWRKVAPGGDPARRVPGEIRVPLPAGAALLFNGHLWHSGTRNDSAVRRDALQLTFTRAGGGRRA